MPKREFTKEELKKIYQILSAFSEGVISNPSEEWELDYYDEPIASTDGLKPILKKIEKLLPKDEAERIRKNVLRRRYDTFNNEIDGNAYEKIERAFSERKTLEIGYFNMGSAEVTKRKIDVYHKTMKYIIAYCHLRSAIRKFRTSRIVSAKLTSQKYTIPEGFNKNDY